MRLIIDTDAGVDDAEAILLALAHASVEAITTVTGNCHVGQVNRNVCTTLQAAGAQVPVYSGAALPIVEPWQEDDEPYHLNDGMGDWDERPPCEPSLEAEHAVQALVRLISENPGELTLVALGPLTNIALAVRLDPTLPQKVKQFIVMGGAVRAHGNTDRITAEWNIRCDPEAAHIAFANFPMITLVSWEATLENSMPWEQYEALCALDTPLAAFYRGITAKTTARYRSRKPQRGGHLLPDPLAMAVTLRPELILERDTRPVIVELQGQHTRGQTVVDYSGRSKQPANVQIVERVDMDGVYRLYREALGGD